VYPASKIPQGKTSDTHHEEYPHWIRNLTGSLGGNNRIATTCYPFPASTLPSSLLNIIVHASRKDDKI